MISMEIPNSSDIKPTDELARRPWSGQRGYEFARPVRHQVVLGIRFDKVDERQQPDEATDPRQVAQLGLDTGQDVEHGHG
jgi:hypothetical protein